MTPRLILFSTTLIVYAIGSTTLQAQEPNAGTVAAEICASCHGPNGDSISSAVPRLASQQKAYLDLQLRAFRDHTRADPMAQAFMWGMTAQLSDATIAGLADYYSRQAPPAGKAATSESTRAGQAIFQNGIPATSVPACQTCHGPRAEGNATAPRLAGQHAEYLVKQIVSFQGQLRAEAGAPAMHAVSGPLTLAQGEAVAAYVSSLGK